MELKELLLQIDELKKEANSIKPVKPEFEKVFWDKFRLEFNYNSNHIEGNTLTYGHTQLLLLFDKVGGDYSLRELEEMKAHDVAMKLVRDSALDPEHTLTEKFIKEINELILVRPFYKEAITQDGQPTRRLIEPGQYKKYPNSVRLENGEVFNYTSPEETPAQMGDLMDWYKREAESKELHPVQIAAQFHYKFVRIHPFDDSNGRTSRLFMNYIHMRNGFAPLVIESADKRNYLFALNRADSGDIEAFLRYIGTLSLRWQEFYTKAIKGEKIEEEGDFDKEVELLKHRLSNNKGPKIEISEEAVKNIIYNAVLPLFMSIDNKLSKFQELFARKSFFITCPGFSQNFDNTTLFENYFNPVISALKSGGELKIEFTHYGFKKGGTNIFNIYLGISIEFSSFVYKIKINNFKNDILEKLYDEILTTEETEAVSKTLAKIELDEIQKRTL